MNAFQYTFYSQITNSKTLTKPQIKFYSLFLRKSVLFNCQFVWNTLDPACFESFLIFFTEQEILPFLIIAETADPKHLNLLPVNTEFFSELDF